MKHGSPVDRLMFWVSGKRILIPESIGIDVKMDEVGDAYLVLALERGRRTTYVVLPGENASAMLEDAGDLLSVAGRCTDRDRRAL